MDLIIGRVLEMWWDGLYMTVAMLVFLLSTGFVIWLIYALIYIVIVKRQERQHNRLRLR